MRGGWVYIMANRYRGSMYSGVTANLPARIYAHRQGHGSKTVREKQLFQLVWAEPVDRIEDGIAFEKRLERWRRQWKFDLIERANPNWDDLYDLLMGC